MRQITLPLPPAINRMYKTTRFGGFYKSKEAKDWVTSALWEIKRQCKAIQKLTGPLYVGLTYFNKRDRDIDSMLKPTLDVLEESGLIENDMNIQHLNVKKCTDKVEPHVEIEIENL